MGTELAFAESKLSVELVDGNMKEECPIPESQLKPKCSNCKGAHSAWASICLVHQEAVKKAKEA